MSSSQFYQLQYLLLFNEKYEYFWEGLRLEYFLGISHTMN